MKKSTKCCSKTTIIRFPKEGRVVVGKENQSYHEPKQETSKQSICGEEDNKKRRNMNMVLMIN